MIPVLQLDPATLSIWFNLELVAAGPEGATLTELVQKAVFGDKNVINKIRAIRDPKLAARAAHLVSCVWHEKRHFIDLVLSNYGALRVRQYFTIYLNTMRLLQECHHEKYPLVCPLDAMCDPFRLKLLGVSEVGENLKLQGCNIRARKRMLADDRAPIDTMCLGPVEVGGEAQLEMLACLTQFAALQELLGLDVAANVFDDIPDLARFNQKYRWAIFLAHAVGAIPKAKPAGERRFSVDVSLFSAMLLAGLSCRVWKQEQTVVGEYSSSYLPSMRLAGIFSAFKNHGSEFDDATPTAVWDAVNQIGKELWGRTVIEEIEADYAHEEKFIETFRRVEYDVSEAALACLEDYHRLRGCLISLLRDTPEMFVSIKRFVHELLPFVAPLPILAKPSGFEGDVPEGWERVLGFRFLLSDMPGRFEGWWAVTPVGERVEPIALTERKHWLTLTSEYAPIAKLLMNGFSHRTILGPELVFGIKRLEALDIKVVIDPMFLFPPDSLQDAGYYWRLTSLPEARCDLCSAIIPSGSGFVLSPWVWRRSAELAEILIRYYGGGEKGRYRFWQDWSIWLVCEDCETRYIEQGPN
jgi:hypothetical protein